MRILSLILLLALTACKSQEELRLVRADQEIAECKELGFKENTKDFANCRLQVRAASANQDAANAAHYNSSQQNYWNTYNAVTRRY